MAERFVTQARIDGQRALAARVAGLKARAAQVEGATARATVPVLVAQPLLDDDGRVLDPTKPFIINLQRLIPHNFFAPDDAQTNLRDQVVGPDSHVFPKLADTFHGQAIPTCTIKTMDHFMSVLDAVAHYHTQSTMFITPDNVHFRSFQGTYFDPTQQPRGMGLAALWARKIMMENNDPAIERFHLPPVLVRLALTRREGLIAQNQNPKRTMLFGQSFVVMRKGQPMNKIAPNFNFGANADLHELDDVRIQDGRLVAMAIPTVGKSSNKGPNDLCVVNCHIVPGTITAVHSDELAAALNIHQERVRQGPQRARAKQLALDGGA